MESSDIIPDTLSCSSDANSNRLGKCEVCNTNNAKYACPKCEVKTCSLRCNKIHKLEVECDGNRDKTKYVPLNKFTNMDLESDFKLLETITENVTAIKKKFGRRPNNMRDIPIPLIKLRNAAYKRKTILKFLPFKFVRRRTNTTQLNFKTNCINWHIEWVFVNAENLRLNDTRIPETEKIGSVLSKYLVKQEDKVLNEKLQYYQATDINGLKLYLKAEQKQGRKFYEMDCSLSIKENLAKKLIIEYPTIHVLLKGHEGCYDVIDSDDEDMGCEDTKLGSQVVEQIIKKAESDDSLYDSLKNLLFISEYSDEEQN
ncbi:hypothetical protein ABEB36_014864 [Hypothenemus hampei]|uniref:Box C/D snoRNA protein 1 n=1 Tax=Hypothenemus hampei TaxID=57062 RepID=A0ABD1E1D0_HYPHA